MAFVRDRRDNSSARIIFDNGTSPRDRPLPSPQACSDDESFPNAELREVLDKTRAQRHDYADHVPVREQDILPLHESRHVTRTLGRKMPISDTSSLSKEAEAATSGTAPPCISARLFPLWQLRFFIRADQRGFFHVYPQVGGPFQTVQEAENAITRHLDGLRSPEMCTDGLSRSEICIRNTLYWPDGTRKKSSENCPKRRNMVALVHSVLDKYNEDHNLFLDHAYKLEDLVTSGAVHESGSCRHMFYHINFTRKRERADGSCIGDDNLFFAEVKCLKGENEEYVLNCLCAVKPNDKGRCYGCENNASVDLKHPTDAHKYEGGHSRPHPRCRGLSLPLRALGSSRAYDDEEAMLAAEESRIRHIYKCLDDEAFVAKLDGSRVAASSVTSKIGDGQGKEPRKYGIPAKLDGATRAAPGISSKREDGQGKGSRGYYVVPAKRTENMSQNTSSCSC